MTFDEYAATRRPYEVLAPRPGYSGRVSRKLTLMIKYVYLHRVALNCEADAQRCIQEMNAAT